MPSRRTIEADRRSRRITLRPSQIRAVADRRLHDAKRLLDAGARHANGAVYLAGYVIECHLKADLLAAYPSIAVVDASGLDRASQRRWELLFRRHDLDALIAHSSTASRLRVRAGSAGELAVQRLKQVAAVWSVHLRYETREVGLAQAGEFVRSVERLHGWLAQTE